VVVKKICVACSKYFEAKEGEVKRGKGRCCSLSCAARLAATNRDQFGEKNPNWKGGITESTDYRSKEHLRTSKARYRAKYREKHLAHKALQTAVARGKIKRGICEICGEEDAHAHHYDYSKPLKVQWLCKAHHEPIHQPQ